MKWLIDVKFYYHNIKNSSIAVTNLLTVKSLLTNKESLTLKIKNKFFYKNYETKFIKKNIFFLNYIFDFLFWYSYRVFSYTFFLIKKIFINVIFKNRNLISSL